MKKELDEQLCKAFPSLYRDRNAPKTETCMCWGFPGDGWYNLINELSGYIESVLVNARGSKVYDYKKANGIDFLTKLTPEQEAELGLEGIAVVADQVKEKFGGLRFYWHGLNLGVETYNKIAGAVDFAEGLSFITCEDCGMPGKVRSGGWIRTLCDECASPCPCVTKAPERCKDHEPTSSLED